MWQLTVTVSPCWGKLRPLYIVETFPDSSNGENCSVFKKEQQMLIYVETQHWESVVTSARLYFVAWCTLTFFVLCTPLTIPYPALLLYYFLIFGICLEVKLYVYLLYFSFVQQHMKLFFSYNKSFLLSLPMSKRTLNCSGFY